jgi:hypothetical protein
LTLGLQCAVPTADGISDPWYHRGMGTDYVEFQKPCPCGKSTIRVGCSSPDHAWVSSYSVHWDCTIQCLDCQRDYMIEGTDRAMRIVPRADMAAMATRRSAHDAACKKFMASKAVEALKNDFVAHLDSLKAIATIHRYLQANGLESYSIGSFRKHWQGTRDWVEHHVFVRNVGKIAGLLGQDAAVLNPALAQIESLKDAIGSVPTVMGQITQWPAS